METIAPTPTLPGPGKTLLLVLWGIGLWYGAALLLAALGASGWLDDATLPWGYALTVPGTWPFIVLVCGSCRLSAAQSGIGISVVVAAALLCDAFAVGYFPSLYGTDATIVRRCAATVFWGAGVALVLGLLYQGLKERSIHTATPTANATESTAS